MNVYQSDVHPIRTVTGRFADILQIIPVHLYSTNPGVGPVFMRKNMVDWTGELCYVNRPSIGNAGNRHEQRNGKKTNELIQLACDNVYVAV